jgi:hypothetical protein
MAGIKNLRETSVPPHYIIMANCSARLTYEEMELLKPCSVCGGRRYWLGDRFWECATCIPTALEGKISVELAGGQTMAGSGR